METHSRNEGDQTSDNPRTRQSPLQSNPKGTQLLPQNISEAGGEKQEEISSKTFQYMVPHTSPQPRNYNLFLCLTLKSPADKVSDFKLQPELFSEPYLTSNELGLHRGSRLDHQADTASPEPGAAAHSPPPSVPVVSSIRGESRKGCASLSGTLGTRADSHALQQLFKSF